MQEEAADFFLPTDMRELLEGFGDKIYEFAGKTVLITGAGGFLGRYFVETFKHMNRQLGSARSINILAIDNFINASITESISDNTTKSESATWIKHDVALPYEPTRKVDFIFHAAGIASPFYYRKYPLQTLDVAVNGTRQMLDLASQHQARMVYFSSSEIYGDPDHKNVPTHEDYRGNVSCLGPRACYDESKRVGETLCRIYSQEYRVGVAIVRPFNVYGPGMKQADYRVLPNFASQVVAGKPLSVYGSGKQTRTFCYITDALNGFLRAALYGLSGEPYNIGNPRPEVSMLELAQEIQQVSNQPVTIELKEYPQSYPEDEPQRRCPNINKASLQLGYEPIVSLPEGLKRFFRWALAHYQVPG